jgi:hypothetical protein
MFGAAALVNEEASSKPVAPVARVHLTRVGETTLAHG